MLQENPKEDPFAREVKTVFSQDTEGHSKLRGYWRICISLPKTSVDKNIGSGALRQNAFKNKTKQKTRRSHKPSSKGSFYT